MPCHWVIDSRSFETSQWYHLLRHERSNKKVQNSSFFLDISNLEDKTTTSFRNVGNGLPSDVASRPRTEPHLHSCVNLKLRVRQYITLEAPSDFCEFANDSIPRFCKFICHKKVLYDVDNSHVLIKTPKSKVKPRNRLAFRGWKQFLERNGPHKWFDVYRHYFLIDLCFFSLLIHLLIYSVIYLLIYFLLYIAY